MHVDVIDLRDFYAQPLGLVARRIIAARLRKLWPSVRGERILGLGYATPYLAHFRDEALMTAAAMPAPQGVVRWPARGPAAACLVEETALPFADTSIDRVLIVHGVEMADALPHMLREAWRVLVPGGQLMVVAPNRRGLWARVDLTPFGQGRPFSRGQLSQVLRDGMFSPEGWGNALYVPPFRLSWLLRSAVAWERLGAVVWPGFSGVVIVAAVKEIYGVVPRRAVRLAERLRPGLVRGARPVASYAPPLVPRDSRNTACSPSTLADHTDLARFSSLP